LSAFRALLRDALLLRLLLAALLLLLLVVVLLLESIWLLLCVADAKMPSLSCSSNREQQAMCSRRTTIARVLAASMRLTGCSCHGWARARTSASQKRIQGTPCACCPFANPWHAVLQAFAHCSTKSLYAPAGSMQQQGPTSLSLILGLVREAEIASQRHLHARQ
jgi:hypothetical protein